MTDERELLLRRVVVPTPVGHVVVRAGRREGGPATILLHGAAGAWTTWTPLIAASDCTPDRLHDVVAVDLPGWGESGSAGGIGRVEDMTDAVAAVARALGHSSWRVVGHSLGGVIALDLAARHPRETRGVLLVSPSGAGVLEAVRRPVRRGLALPWFAGMLTIMRALAPLGRVGTAVVRAFARLRALPLLTAPLFAGRVDPSVVAAFGREVRPAAFARAARLAAAYDETAWRRIVSPVRTVRGARDVFAGATDAAALRALIPGVRAQRLAGTGHFAHIERPDAVLAALGELDRAGGGSGRTTGGAGRVARRDGRKVRSAG